MDVFLEISLILMLATAIAAVTQLLRQPLIIGYIVTGLLVGPAFLNLVHSTEVVELFSHMGIALLLFIIGLGLNPRIIREVGKIAVMTGVGQVLFTTTIGFGVASLLGFSTVHAIYIAIALAFSSTIIILKLLSDKKDNHRLYGKVATGFLLVQDIIAVMALVAVTALGQNAQLSAVFTETLIKGVGFIAVIALLSIYVLPRFTNFLARSQEFLFLFSVGWGLGIAAIAMMVGFSIEIGALAAGVALAGSPYSFEISSRMRPLRDFFIVLFFIVLGSNLELGNLAAGLGPAVVFSLLILIGNPLIVMTIMGLLKFTRKTSFKAGLTVAQISEFSLILLLLGRQVGHLDDAIVAMMTLVAMVTIAVSTYAVIYSDQLYARLEPYLKLFERKHHRGEQEAKRAYDAVLFGFKAGSRSFLDAFGAMGKSVLVVDYDPEVVELLEADGVECLYGDANDSEFLEDLPLEKAKIVIATMGDFAANALVVEHTLARNPRALVIATAEEPAEASSLYDKGASYVMIPHFLGSISISASLRQHERKVHEYFDHARAYHLKYLARSIK